MEKKFKKKLCFKKLSQKRAIGRDQPKDPKLLYNNIWRDDLILLVESHKKLDSEQQKIKTYLLSLCCYGGSIKYSFVSSILVALSRL